MSDDLETYTKEEPDDWRKVHRAVYRIDQSWVILGPIAAIATNWKAWLFGIGVYAFLRRSEIVAALDVIAGVTQ